MDQNSDESFVRELFARFLDNRCSDDEIRLLMDYADREEYREIFSGMMNEAGTNDHLTEEALYALHKNVIDEVALHITPPVHTATVKVRRLIPYQAAAAMALLIMAAGVWYWFPRSVKDNNSAQQVAVQKPVNDLPPAGKKAVLILADGASLALDSASSGVLTTQGNTQIVKSGGGSLVYTPGAGQAGREVYNTIITPRGGQYQVTLSDGTKVWLNTASSLRYPTAFAEKQRKVVLTGEAYFEVAQDADKPFIVAANNTQVTVLGTNFNVMAYKEEALINTTLLQGAVRVSEGEATTLLAPGQQAQSDQHGNIRLVKNADIHAAVAWKNGLFWFDEDDIQSVMRQLSREYNIEVEIRGNIKRHFTGSIPRNVNVSTVFEILEKTGGVHFTMNNGKIIVTP